MGATVDEELHARGTDRRRVLVLGARGHLGRLAMAACREREDLEVRGASRRAGAADERVDLNDSGTLAVIDRFDVVIDAVDTSRADPLVAARAAVRAGAIFLATSADPAAFRSLMDADLEGPGTVVLGAGTFPGLSTTLLQFAPAGVPLEFRAAWSVLSAAGPGTVEVMVDALSAPALTIAEGEPRELPPLTVAGQPEVDGARRVAIALSAPDVLLAGRGRGATDVRFVAATRPALPAAALRAGSWLAARGLFGSAPARAAARLAFRAVRGALFGRRTTPLTIELWTGDERIASVRCSDAFGSGAAHIALLASRWPRAMGGVRLPYEGVPAEVVRRELGDRVRIDGAAAARP